MKRLLLLTAIFLSACGPSQEEKRQVEIEQQRIEQEASEQLAKEKADRVAAVTCSIMGETRKIDSAVRVRELNDAREKIGGEPFLGGDSAIKQSFEYGLCRELVLNDPDYYGKLTKALEIERTRLKAERLERETRKEAERLALEVREKAAKIEREKQEEDARIARKKREETARIESERAFAAGAKNRELVKKLLAEGKEVSLHTNGQISMIRPNKDSSLNGNVERFYKNGQMMFKAPYQNGKKEGISEYYDYDGNLTSKKCFKDGSEISLEKCK
jgi:hypothetical protein